MSDDNMSDEEIEAVVMSAINELLNIAAGVAELQTTDEGAEEIYAVCDLVAEYYQIERVMPITEENADGSFTTHFESYTGTPAAPATQPRTTPIPGSIRTKGKPKLRLIDCDTPLDTDDKQDDED